MAQLRANYGSHRKVHRVFAYDPATETALVLWKDQYDGDRESIGEAFVNELEAVNKDGSYADVRAELAKRTGYTVRDKECAA